MLSRKVWSLRSAALHCGAGSAGMPSARGNIEPGSSLAIPTSPIKPVRSSIFTNGFGKVPHLGPDDYVISADEKTSIQARRRKQPTLPPAPGRPTRVEHEYFRQGAWTYLAAWRCPSSKSLRSL
jgi:hypothetical protein